MRFFRRKPKTQPTPFDWNGPRECNPLCQFVKIAGEWRLIEVKPGPGGKRR